jgi:hypothetical protein
VSLAWLDVATWRVLDGDESGAVRVDGRALDAEGAPAWVSLSLGPSIPFDDRGVSGALRRYLAGPPRRAVTTLLADEVRYVGAIVVGDLQADVKDDPFDLVYPRRIVRVPAGVFGRMSHPADPGIARYQGGVPWPYDSFG